MRVDKNCSRRRLNLQQDEHCNQACLRLNYPSWSRPRSHWSATGPRNQHTTTQTKHSKHAAENWTTCYLCRSDRWLLPVRPMTPVSLVDSAGQASDTQQVPNKAPGSLSDFFRPWNIKHEPGTHTHTWPDIGIPPQSLSRDLEASRPLPL
jgi:hypothetical protein